MLVSKKELANLKLQSIRSDNLKIFAESLGIDSKGKTSDIIKRLIDVPQDQIDEFIKRKYQDLTRERQALISDGELKKRINESKGISLGRSSRTIRPENSDRICP